MTVTIRANTNALIADLRRLRAKALPFAFKRTLDQCAYVAWRDIDRQYRSAYNPKRKGMMRALSYRPTRARGKPPSATKAKRGGRLLNVSRAFVPPRGRAKPAVLFNKASNDMVKRMVDGGTRKPREGKRRTLVPAKGPGARVRRGAKSVVVDAGKNRVILERRRGGRTELLGTLTRETKRIRGRLNETLARRKAGRAAERIFRREVLREIRAFHGRTTNNNAQ